MIGFRCHDRFVRFHLQFPAKDDPRFRSKRGRSRFVNGVYVRESLKDAHDQEVRRRWRALCLVIKAKLEAVESGITTFEQEFMAHIVMPDGKTVAEHLVPAIEQAYQTGKMPKLLPAFAGETEAE